MWAMPIATVNILFWWFLLIPDEFEYGTNYIENVISLTFYAYIEHQKWSMDAIHFSINVIGSQ
jgi:hypothetical protein